MNVLAIGLILQVIVKSQTEQLLSMELTNNTSRLAHPVLRLRVSSLKQKITS